MVNKIIEKFKTISSIPRCSKNEKRIIDYLVRWALSKHYFYEIDKAGNLLIYADKKINNAIILQAHVDMVCEKDKGSDHDFKNDPIKILIDGDIITADGTSLGADNGVGVAMAIVLMEDYAPEINIKLLFTVDEETGLNGAKNLDPSFLNGNFLINLDSEDDDTIIVGCAGGVDLIATKKLEKVEALKANYYSLLLDNFSGGHSGIDIDKGFGNAIKVLGEILHKSGVYKISKLSGGTAHNAIPRSSYAEFAYEGEQDTLIDVVESELCRFMKESPTYKIDKIDRLCSIYDCSDVIKTIRQINHGVFSRYLGDYEGVESSSNLAKIDLDDKGVLVIVESLRGSSETSIISLKKEIEKSLDGFNYYYCCDYPGWQPKKDSKLLEIAKKVYKDLFTEDVNVKVIHAGLECGIFINKNDKLDIISIGPTIRNPHSPFEKTYISSIEKTYKFLKRLIGEIVS